MMAWSEDVIQSVWERGSFAVGTEADRWRKDTCGAWICRQEYGNRQSQYGWEIDHIDPHGGDQLANLRPLQWKNYADKSDGRLKCNVTASGNKNVDKSLG